MDELPLYQCHKRVRACKIDMIFAGTGHAYPGDTIVPLDTRIKPFPVKETYLTKHDPKPGGYFVEYEDGYQSYSPADAFEKGYILVE